MRHALLALLAKEPAYPSELKRALETEFGALWPANDGQVYVLLGRLEAAGLVGSDGGARGRRKVYELTADGREELRRWLDEPIEATPFRVALLAKVVLAHRGRLADPVVLIDRQRRAHLRRLREVQRLAKEVPPDCTEALLVEGAALHLQADLRWLELCERHYTNEIPGDRDDCPA